MRINKYLLVAFLALAAGFATYVVLTLKSGATLDEASPIVAAPADVPEMDETKLPPMDEAVKADFIAQSEAERETVIEAEEAMPAEPRIVASGEFMRYVHSVEGRALFIEGKDSRTLRFEDFSTDNGPDLYVYLSADKGTKDIIDLGRIRATHGNVNYEVPKEVDITKYKYVLIWCRPFGVLFSYALLEPTP